MIPYILVAHPDYQCRDAPRVKNPVGQVVMRRIRRRRRCPAAPSDLPKSGGAAAPPAPPFGASLFIIKKTLKYLNIIILFLICLLFQRRHELTRKPGQTMSHYQ